MVNSTTTHISCYYLVRVTHLHVTCRLPTKVACMKLDKGEKRRKDHHHQSRVPFIEQVQHSVREISSFPYSWLILLVLLCVLPDRLELQLYVGSISSELSSPPLLDHAVCVFATTKYEKRNSVSQCLFNTNIPLNTTHRLIRQTIEEGGYLSHSLFVPKGVWTQVR